MAEPGGSRRLTDPETGETHTMSEWAKIFAARIRKAALEEHQALHGGTGGFCPCCGRQESDYMKNGHDPECFHVLES